MSKLWGSRFEKGTDRLADAFSYSISYDYRLAQYDVMGSMAHAKMLGKCKIISQSDSKKLVSGLAKIGKQIIDGKFKFDPTAEDIHTDIQQKLKAIVGDAADKLHTARSRNDLIVLDMKLYCMDQINQIIDQISELQKAIVTFAAKNKEIIIPAYTHLQAAQVVLLAHHMLAYVEMLERDKSRLYGAFKRTNIMPLGSCALSGTSLPIDRKFVAKELGFADVTANSMDTVSDRDFIIELLSDIAIVGIHTSRIAEDFIIWATGEFKFVTIDWSLCTGSSIMPHKKNPDILELIRGESANLSGNLNKLLLLTKGLPLTYNRDLQLDKPPLFESVEKIQFILPLLTKHFQTVQFNEDVVEKRIKDESFFTVDVMDYLIKAGLSYRQAHDVVGKMVKDCLDKGIFLSSLSLEQFKAFSPVFTTDVKKLFNAQMSVKIKTSLGSTNPQLVDQQIKLWQKKLNQKGKG